MDFLIDVPVYCGVGIKVFWDKNSVASLSANYDCVILSGNQSAFMSLAKQLLYFCFNTLPRGAHVHFDSFFCKSRLTGLSLLIELKPDIDNTDKCRFDEIPIPAILNIPENPFDTLWHSGAEVSVTYDKTEVCICGNKEAFFLIAKKLLSLCCIDTGDANLVKYCYPHRMDGWSGSVICFQMFA